MFHCLYMCNISYTFSILIDIYSMYFWQLLKISHILHQFAKISKPLLAVGFLSKSQVPSRVRIICRPDPRYRFLSNNFILCSEICRPHLYVEISLGKKSLPISSPKSIWILPPGTLWKFSSFTLS